ncbi:MAG: YlxR family protein [Clostridia bacterium]|nr:YlxR family protein [Clostridia bacterium]
MHQKKIPLRKCTGCNEMKEKKQLVRIVKTPDKTDENGNIIQKSEILVDLTGKKSGRGAYICPNPECLKAARKARRLEKAFSCKIPDELYDQLEKELEG